LKYDQYKISDFFKEDLRQILDFQSNLNNVQSHFLTIIKKPIETPYIENLKLLPKFMPNQNIEILKELKKEIGQVSENLMGSTILFKIFR
jgi:hypothetical protein